MWDIAARRPAWVAMLAISATVLAAFGALRLEPVTDFVDTVPDDPAVDAYRDLVARLDGVRFVAIYMPRADAASLRDDGFDGLVEEQGALTAWLHQRYPGTFSHTLSAWEAMRAGNYMLEKMATAGHPRPSSYAVPDDPVRYETVKRQVLQSGTLDDVLARDGSSAMLLAFFATDDNLEARRLSGDVAAALPAWHRQQADPVTGPPSASGLLVSSDYTDQRNAKDLRTFGLVALGAVTLSMLWVLRRPSHVALAVGGVMAATVWTFGIMGAAGWRINFLTLFLAPVVIGIGIDHSVHLLHRVAEERGRRPPREAVAEALRHAGPAMAVAGITTSIGLAVVSLVPNPLFSQIAAVAALGIALALVASLLLVPASAVLLSERLKSPWVRRGRGARGHGRAQGLPLLAQAAKGVHARPAAAWGGALLVTALCVTGLTQLRVESGSAENEFPQDDPLIVLQHRIEKEYGAFQRAYLIVRGDMTDPAALQALHAYAQRAAGLPLFRQATSVADLLLADEATDQGAADVLSSTLLGTAGQAPDETARLPQTKEEARQRLDRLMADPLWRGITPFTITSDYRLAVVAVKLDPWHDQDEMVRLQDALGRLAAEMQAGLPSHDVHAGGAPVNRAAVVEQTPINVAVATVGAAAAVGGVLAVAWRKRGREGLRVMGLGVGLVLLASLWLLASIPLLDAVYRWTGTGNRASLTDMFLLAFAITIAAGIDDLVHLASRYWEARDRGRDAQQALTESFTHAGRAVTGTTLTTGIAFAVLSGVYFLQSKNLAILTAAGVVYAYVLTLLLAPRVLAGRPARAAAAASPSSPLQDPATALPARPAPAPERA